LCFYRRQYSTPHVEAQGVTRVRFVVRCDDYAYIVPFVEDERTVFLKTIIPSRRATKQYLGEEAEKDQA
jgi:hypothetical protein